MKILREREMLSFTFFSREVTSFESGVKTFSRLTLRGRAGIPKTVVTSTYTTVKITAQKHIREHDSYRL
jgi:hypothetical protein